VSVGPQAALVQRLRKAIGLRVADCRQMLAMLPERERERVVAEYENGRPFVPWYRPSDAPERIRDLSGWEIA
jgi:hypothetical protein